MPDGIRSHATEQAIVMPCVEFDQASDEVATIQLLPDER